MDITRYLLAEVQRHSCLAPQDIVKLCFQAAFGAEHMLSNFAQAYEYFSSEYEATAAEDKPLVEYIAPTVCRVNLAAWKKINLQSSWLWNLFAYSATTPSHEYSHNDFHGYIAQADELCQAKLFPFPYDEWKTYIRSYTEAGAAPVHHSAAYRQHAKPAYRIISGYWVQLLPILEAMAGHEKGVIAIDGRAASGKSTLSTSLRDVIYWCYLQPAEYELLSSLNRPGIIIRMDDFFLPPALRTAERLAEPGGNIHYERFIKEALPGLKTRKGFSYRKFDCSCMDYRGTVEIAPYRWRIVEGVYSCHPIMGNYMDIRVFMDIHPNQQQSRISSRNTPNIAAQYFDKWIPMEETYFKAYGVREAADVVIPM